MSDIRKQLHRLAELAHGERQSAAFVAATLRNGGVEQIREGIGGYGLLATIDSGRPGPGLLFRAELDALPIDETIALSHASRTGGVAHKCGHDGHMAILIGVAHRLRQRPLSRGKVQLLFQPAEETGEGAEKMLADHKLSDLAPDYAYAIHNLPGFPLHSVLLRTGVFASGSAGLEIGLKGNTAHAAHPEQGRSPARAVASLIPALEELPARVLQSGRFGLSTVIHARIGDPAFGTTPGKATVMVTVRAREPEDLQHLRKEAVSLAGLTAADHGLTCDHKWTEVFYPTINDEKAVALVRSAAGRMSVVSGISHREHPFSWSEDFGRFTERFPGALIGLGAGRDHPHLHDTQYDFPDVLIDTGIGLLTGIIDEVGLF